MIIIILRYSLLPLSSEMINIFNVTIDMAVVSLISEFQIDAQLLGQVPGISTIWNAFGLVVRRKSFGRKFNQIWKTVAAQRVPQNQLILRLYNDSHFHHFKDLKSQCLSSFSQQQLGTINWRESAKHIFFFGHSQHHLSDTFDRSESELQSISKFLANELCPLEQLFAYFFLLLIHSTSKNRACRLSILSLDVLQSWIQANITSIRYQRVARCFTGPTPTKMADSR